MTTFARPLNRFEAAALGVNTKVDRAGGGIKGRSIGGESSAPAFEVSGVFTFQSYFDSTLLQNAILAQPPNELIVPSTKTKSQVSGYGLGLHPSSECPVAVRFQTGAQQGASQVYHLKPGQVIRPHGSMRGEAGSFSGFEWGLPFGWLGGGAATIVVMRTPDADVFWTGNPEIIFHRQRMLIYAPAAVPVAASIPLNWPKRFPWPNAIYGANNIQQSGRAALSVTPTRTALRLRVSTLAAVNTMRVLFCGTNDWSQDSAGAVSLADVSYTDVVWGTFDQGGIGTPGTHYPTQVYTGELERFAADDGGVVFADLTGDIDGEYVDVIRYGTL